MIKRFEVERGVSQGSIAIWDRLQDNFKIAEVYPSMFRSEARARKLAEQIAEILERTADCI
jgi:hypothetical protein